MMFVASRIFQSVSHACETEHFQNCKPPATIKPSLPPLPFHPLLHLPTLPNLFFVTSILYVLLIYHGCISGVLPAKIEQLFVNVHIQLDIC